MKIFCLKGVPPSADGHWLTHKREAPARVLPFCPISAHKKRQTEIRLPRFCIHPSRNSRLPFSQVMRVISSGVTPFHSASFAMTWGRYRLSFRLPRTGTGDR